MYRGLVSVWLLREKIIKYVVLVEYYETKAAQENADTDVIS